MNTTTLLTSKELVEDIKKRQTELLNTLRQTYTVQPRLAIIVTVDNPVIDVYMRKKQEYGASLGITVDVHRIKQSEAAGTIQRLNADPSVHGIIVQLPLEQPEETEEIVRQVAPEKDVDGLGEKPAFNPATPMAILWLIEGHNVDLKTKKVLLVGRGKLVGAPLERMLGEDGVDVTVATRKTTDLATEALKADVIITATGVHGIINSAMVKSGAVVVDAGTASEGGKTVGDAAPDLYTRDDISITPTKGGVGPLTVCTLMENVIKAAERSAKGE